MGVQTSKAANYVDSVIDAGISFFNETTNKAYVPFTGDQWLMIKGCHNVNISDVSFDQRYVLHTDLLASSISDASFETKLNEAIKEAAESKAKGGIGVQDAKSTIVEHVVTQITQAFKTSTQNIISAPAAVAQGIGCEDSSNVNIYRVSFNQSVAAYNRSIAQSDAMMQAKEDCIKAIAGDTSATATGWDPSFLVFIVIAIGLVIFMAVFGVVGGLLSKPFFWMLLALVGTGVCGYLAVSPLLGWWPGDKINDVHDSDKDIASKKKHNHNLELYSGLAAGGCGVLTAGLGYLTFSKREKKE